MDSGELEYDILTFFWTTKDGINHSLDENDIEELILDGKVYDNKGDNLQKLSKQLLENLYTEYLLYEQNLQYYEKDYN